MKKKKLKNLSLNKTKISKIDAEQVTGGFTSGPCILTTQVASILICSMVAGSCGCPPVSDNCDHTRGCPSWNVACNK